MRRVGELPHHFLGRLEIATDPELPRISASYGGSSPFAIASHVSGRITTTTSAPLGSARRALPPAISQ